MSPSLSFPDGEAYIVESAVKGEASAFGLLYDHYQPKIYRFVFIKVSRREDAEDLTHQVFLNAWQNIARYKNIGFPFSSWLYQIARNQVIDFYRTRKAEARIDEVSPEYFLSPAVAEFEIDQNIELTRVREAILKLKPDYQDVVIMRFVEELSPKEVAAAVKKSEGAVKLIQHRAIKQLKQLLQ